MAFCDAAAAAAPASLPDPDATAAPAAAVAHLTSGARSFGSLADVEVQSVLRLLDSRSRLRAARCSRHLYRLVQAPFVWQDGAPFLVRSSQTDFATRLREHPLLRHAPIHLRVERSGKLATAEEVLSLPWLHSLTARGWAAAPCEAVLRLPRVQQHLRVLHLPTNASPSLLSLVATACPVLTELSFNVGPLITEATSIEALGVAPCLSSIRLFFLSFGEHSGVLSGLRACSQLTSLSLHEAKLDAAMLAALHSPELTARLQHLTLVGLRVPVQSHALLSQAPAGLFGPLARLQSLTMGTVRGCSLNTLLQRVPLPLEQLELYIIPSTPHGGSVTRIDLQPSTLQAALQEAPELSVRLAVRDSVLQYYQTHRQGGADGSSNNGSTSLESTERPTVYPGTLRLAAVDPVRVEFVAWRGSALAREAELRHISG